MTEYRTRVGRQPLTGDRLGALSPKLIPGAGMERTIAKNITVQPDGCWHWRGRPDRYGVTRWNNEFWYAHRLLYCMFNKITGTPPGMHVHHRCEVRGCVNPDHLVLLAHSDHSALHAAKS